MGALEDDFLGETSEQRCSETRPFTLIRYVRATWTAFDPIGTKHEVIGRELAPSVEQIRKAHFALGTVENIILVDPSVRQLATLAAEFIAQACQLLFLGQGNRCFPCVANRSLETTLCSRVAVEFTTNISCKVSELIKVVGRYFFFCVAFRSARWRILSNHISQPLGIPSACWGKIKPMPRCTNFKSVPLP